MRNLTRRARLSTAGLFAALLVLGACSDQLPLEPMADAPRGPSFSESVNLQATPPGYIRIGVVPSATSITIGSAGAWTLVDKASETTLFSSTGGTVTVNLLSAGEVRTRDWIQVTCAFSTASRDDLLTRARAAGFEAYTEAARKADGTVFCWRVRLGTLPARTAVTGSPQQPTQAGRDFQARLQAAGLPSTGLWYTVTQVTGESQLQLVHGEIEKIATGPVVLRAPGENVTINGQPYRGVAEVWTNSRGTLAGINELPFEQYLYGVVPRELPPTIWYQVEAQKAQAVVARTFALANFNKRAADGYNLLATQDDQVYGGFGAEHPISTAAVDGTTGVVATYQGGLISTYYSSTSGGYTASFEEWLDGADPVPYLKAVPDAQRGEAFAQVPSLEVFKRASNPTNLRNAGNGDFEADWSRYHRWVYDWTADEIRRVISQFAVRDVGEVREINVLQRGPSGRVLEIEYVTQNGTFRSTRNGIRSSLKYVTYNQQGAQVYNNFRSTLFFIEPVVDSKTKQVTGFKAYGGGWGHGVGMSQTGAAGMAEKGRGYEEILKHYYQGIELETKQY